MVNLQLGPTGGELNANPILSLSLHIPSTLYLVFSVLCALRREDLFLGSPRLQPFPRINPVLPKWGCWDRTPKPCPTYTLSSSSPSLDTPLTFFLHGFPLSYTPFPTAARPKQSLSQTWIVPTGEDQALSHHLDLLRRMFYWSCHRHRRSFAGWVPRLAW